jgi:hypothetical protein
MKVRDGFEHGPIGHDHEMPGLFVAGARGGHGRAQDRLQVGLGHGLGRKRPDAASGVDDFEEFHAASLLWFPLYAL